MSDASLSLILRPAHSLISLAHFLSRRYGRKSELNMSGGVLSLVYRQALVWSGVAFAPVLSVVGIISTIVCFQVYFKFTMATVS